MATIISHPIKSCTILSRIALMICFVFAVISLHAQNDIHKSLKRIETPQFTLLPEDENCVYLPMEFNSAISEEKLKKIDVNRITTISLIYTQYRQSDRFNQLALNEARTYELYKNLPELKTKTDIRFNWIAQTGCSDPESCKSYFHGFEIKLKPLHKIQEEKINAQQLEFYTSLYSGNNSDTIHTEKTNGNAPQYVKICDTIYTESARSPNRIGVLRFYGASRENDWYKAINKLKIPENQFQLVINPQGKIINTSDFTPKQLEALQIAQKKNLYYKTSRIDGRQVPTQFTFELKKNKRNKIIKTEIFAAPCDKEGNVISLANKKPEYKQTLKCYYVDTSISNMRFQIQENVVYEVLDRNPQWQNNLVVTDVTGSMTAYLGQFLAWHKLNLNDTSGNHDFVFFNDGNNKPDHLKKDGKTGGTYYLNSTNFIDIRKSIMQAQNSGSGGGDLKENDLEAILFGLQENPDVKEVILIADNNAPPRDIALLKQIKKPVHIILCGAQNGLNLAYVNMARNNGGTVHTIEQDLVRLSAMKDGESFVDQNKTYKLRFNEIIQVK